MLDLEKNTF